MTFSIIVPTSGRVLLDRTLRSIVPQLEGEDEVIVVGDGPQPQAQTICRGFGRVVYIEHGPTHCFGNSQRQEGMRVATGDYLLFVDDDDVFVTGALQVVREAARRWPGRPMLFRFIDHNGLVLWRDPVVREANVSTAQIVFPNRPEYLGTWGDRYEGDYDFIRSTMDKWPGGDDAVVWRPNILIDARKVAAA